MKTLSVFIPTLLICFAPSQDDSLEFKSHVHGFRIERPDSSWKVREHDNQADGTYNHVLEPGDTPQGTVQVAVRVKELDTPVTAGQARDAALRSIADRQEIEIKKKTVFRVAGREAPGAVAEMTAMNSKFHIELAYLVEGKRVYNLQRHAPKEEFAQYADAYDRAWNSFGFVEIREDSSPEGRLRGLAAKCGTEIDWTGTWDEAAKRARREKKPVLVVVRSLPGFDISDEANAGLFMDPDITAILRERFVVFRFSKGMDAPFVPQGSSYGIGPYAFGSSILTATPEGEIVGDTCIIEAASFHDFLIEQLNRQPKLTGSAGRPGLKGLDLAEWFLERGDYTRAAKALDDPGNARGYRLKASLLRRLKRGEEALAALARARSAPGGEEAAAQIAADESLVLMRLGRFDETLALLDRLKAEHPESGRMPEALYRIGAVHLRKKDAAKAEEAWTELTTACPENRWAWKAAAALLSTSFSVGSGGRLAWPSVEIAATLGPHDFEPWKGSRMKKARKETVGFLLRTQREDGSWVSPIEAVSPGGGEPSPFTVAITAICGQGLLPHAVDPGVFGSVERAALYLAEAWEQWKTAEEKPYFMDYTVYSMSYMLWFFSDCVEAGMFEKERFEEIAAELVEGIRSKQRSGGGWSYYITSDLKNFDNPLNQSISFISAAALVALLEARDAGFDVPAEMIDKAAGCLERMRNPDGTFEYFLFHDNEDAPRSTPMPGAAGRGPLCATALLMAGRGEKDGVRTALDLFLDFRNLFAREHGKTLMHCGPHAQGSHYLMFDYANCAAAISRLPKKERGKYRAPLIEQILGARTSDGTYIDNPMLGPHYGAGMALIAFWHLDPEKL